MTKVHASVEQFVTALDEILFDKNMEFDVIHNDVRFDLILRALAASGDDFVRIRRLRSVDAALPGYRLHQQEHKCYPLPFRYIYTDRRILSKRTPALIKDYMEAYNALTVEQIEGAVDVSRAMIASVCGGDLVADRWNDDGHLMFAVTKQGSPKYQMPEGTDDLMSQIGLHLLGTGDSNYVPTSLRFSNFDEEN